MEYDKTKTYDMEKDGKDYRINEVNGEVGQDYLDFMKQFYSGRFGASMMPMYSTPFAQMPMVPPAMYGRSAPISSTEYSGLTQPGEPNVEIKDKYRGDSPAMSMTVYHIEVKGDNYKSAPKE